MQCQQCFDRYFWDGVSVPDGPTAVVDPSLVLNPTISHGISCTITIIQSSREIIDLAGLRHQDAIASVITSIISWTPTESGTSFV